MKIYKVIYITLFALFFTGCNMFQIAAPDENSPTTVLRKFVEASQKKDVEAIKQTLSSGTLKMIEESAQRQNMTLDESLKKDDGRGLKEMPETRNEKIEGDTATLEVKNAATNDWDKTPFVKEDGKWKLALDKLIDDLEQKRKDELGISDSKPKPMSNSSNTGSAAKTPAANKK